jgi:cytochrome c-type biogenesis protein CcmH/NrfF
MRRSIRPRSASLLGARLIVLGAALAIAPAAASGAGMGVAAAAARPSLPTIERQVMCVTCKIPLNVAQSPQADRERAFIQSLIDAGQTEAQIKLALVGQYGSTVLALPPTHGFDLAAYLVPVAALLALLAVLGVLLPRWRTRARSASSHGTAPATPLSAADTARLDADLARFD